ncbi:MAG TPA: D-2-hydroxyacid dehydrogenase [Victivallales bacterium]|mgnify:CR=1 FL=1|nr:D-2-hydroxyacid dehydrogenase [Victivallales bacterium]
MRLNIICLDGYTLNPGDNPWTEIEKLGNLKVYDRTPDDLIIERAKNAEILLTNKTPLTASTISNLPYLRFIAVLATGYNVIDIKAAKERKIPVSNVPGYSTDSVAEFTFSLILDLFKKVAHHDWLVKAGRWEKSPDFCFWDNNNFRDLSGKTLGIVGFGEIGRRVANIAKSFKMKILVSTRRPLASLEEGVKQVDIESLFSESDIVSLHCPLNETNRMMVNKNLLLKMKRTAILVNTARGLLINEEDLADALNNGTIAGAACDVVSEEPIKPYNPLLKAKNLIITPHIAWASLESRRRLMDAVAKNISSFLSGKADNVVC